MFVKGWFKLENLININVFVFLCLFVFKIGLIEKFRVSSRICCENVKNEKRV